MNSLKKTLVRILVGVIAICFGFIPLWLYLLAKTLLSPEGFWQEFILVGVGVYFFGLIQLVLLIGLIIFLHSLWYKREWMGFWGI